LRGLLHRGGSWRLSLKQDLEDLETSLSQSAVVRLPSLGDVAAAGARCLLPRQEVATCLLSCEGERKPKALLWFDGERLLSSAGGAVTCDVHLVWQVSVSLTCPPAA